MMVLISSKIRRRMGWSLDSYIYILLRNYCSYYCFIYYQVSTNGLISFRNEYSSRRSSPFSSRFIEFLNPLIAPLWTGFDTSRSGSIYYRTTNDNLVLERIRNVLTEHNAPSLAFIVTWDRIPLFYDPSSIVSLI